MTTERVIEKWRKSKYCGDTIDLKGVQEEDLQFVVDMRNQNKSRYFLNQDEASTIEQQREWYLKYLKRDNDIYWIYCDKKGESIGTIRLYNITDESCELGSSTVDSSRKASFFPFMEAHCLAKKFAVEELKVSMIYADTKIDNFFVDDMLKRLGFVVDKVIQIRKVKYNHYKCIISNEVNL